MAMCPQATAANHKRWRSGVTMTGVSSSNKRRQLWKLDEFVL